MISSRVAAFRSIGTYTYRASRSTSSSSTYFPISLRNSSISTYGRYSSNSCAIRSPTPGIRRISSVVTSLRLIGSQSTS